MYLLSGLFSMSSWKQVLGYTWDTANKNPSLLWPDNDSKFPKRSWYNAGAKGDACKHPAATAVRIDVKMNGWMDKWRMEQLKTIRDNYFPMRFPN